MLIKPELQGEIGSCQLKSRHFWLLNQISVDQADQGFE